MAKALIEHISSMIRIVNDDERYGDKFHWSATMRWLNPWEVEICAYMLEIKPSTRKAIFAEFTKLGIKRIKAINYPNGADGERIERWINVPSKIEQLYSKDLE